MSDEFDEIWSLYADDGAQAMDAMEGALLALEEVDAEARPAHVAALFRAVHTFKGNARVLGLGIVESRAHLAEDLIGLVRDDGVELDAEIRALLLETGDRLRQMLEATAATRADVDPAETEDLMVRLRDKIARCAPPGSAPPPAETEPAPLPEPSAGTDLLPEPFTAELPDPDPLPDPEPAPAPPARTRLADDPAYRAIFDEMASDTLNRLRHHLEAGTPEAAARSIADLDHAAGQLGLDDWQTALRACPTQPAQADLAALIGALDALREAAPASALADPTDGDFFARIAPPLGVISRLGISFAVGDLPDPAALDEAAGEVARTAETEGYVRVAAAARTLTAAAEAEAYRRTELRLYEELAGVEAVLPEGAATGALSPAALLAQWCADHVFDTLDELDATLERMRQGGDPDAGQRALERLVRLVHHACRHYGLVMASDLAMSLLDLFARGHARGHAPDAILMQIARGFVDALELVFDALREGETPDTARLEQLFAEASEAGFAGSGVMTATAIERKLGLPREFHRVLSPESVRAASEALAAGQSFHILRADVNSDQDLAEALFTFIGSGQVQAITNVTVFRGEDTLFDFLIATRLDEVDLIEAVARMDPGGRRLTLTHRLEPAREDAPPASDPAPEASLPAADLSVGVLERIGEIAAGQAMVHAMLHDLSEEDLGEAIDAALRQHGDDPRQARLALRGLAEDMLSRLRDLSQLETQLLGQMAELQQTTAELRARPVETVLRPIAALVATQSRHMGREAQMTTAGAELQLDIALLDSLKRVLRPLVMARLDQAPRRLHLAVNRDNDHLSVVLEDDGSAGPETALDPARAELTRAGGQMRVVGLPGGGQRFHIALPMSLVVLEGMVVGVGGTRYVLPVDAIRTILQPDPEAIGTISATGGQSWLRLGPDEVIAIRPLPGARTEARPAQGQVHVVLRRGEASVAIPVDVLVGQQLVLLRPLRGVMARLRNVTGVALLTGGDVGVVLSPGALCGQPEGPGAGRPRAA